MPDAHDFADLSRVVARLRQGSVLDFGLTTWLADPRRPVHPLSAHAAATVDSSEATLSLTARLGSHSMVVSPTRDLARTSAERAWVTLCPVVALPPDLADVAAVRAGRNPGYVPLPWLPTPGESWVADLHLMHPVERSLVAGAREVARPDSVQARGLADALARYLARPDLPDAVAAYLAPLRARADRAQAQGGDEAIVLGAIDEIRIAGTPGFDGPPPWRLELVVVLTRAALPDTEPDSWSLVRRMPTRRETPVQTLAHMLTEGRRVDDPPFDRAWRAVLRTWVEGLPEVAQIAGPTTFRTVTTLTPAELRATDLVALTSDDARHR